jgi:integrase
MRTVADCDIPPEQIVTLADFTKNVYLPFVKENRRPSTYKNASENWKLHIEPKSRGCVLKDVRIKHVQQWLSSIATTPRFKKNGKFDRTGTPLPPLARNSLARIKSFLSGLFAHAVRFEYHPGPNPVRDTGLNPHAAKPRKQHAYTFEQVSEITALLKEPAATVFYTASFTGLRRGELEGLQWEDYHDGKLHIARSIWNGKVNLPKTEASAGAVPVIPLLAERLDLHRLRNGNPQSGPIFKNSAGHPLSIKNLTDREILPRLNVCQVCGKSQGLPHAEEGHVWIRDPRRPEWKGWHSCRRGVGSNLYRLGVRSKVIQEVLRHANERTTLDYYVKVTGDDSLAAMTKLGENFAEKTAGQNLPDSDRTLNSGQPPLSETVN